MRVAAVAREAATSAAEEHFLNAAVDAFAEKGFHGTSMRDIAARANSSVSHAYYYFPSKRAILFRIIHNITAELAELLDRAAASAGKDPVAMLTAVVRAHVLLHAERQRESFVGNSELRSLSNDEYRAVVGLRDRISGTFKRAIDAGLRSRVFVCREPAETTLALVSMCTAVASWYRVDGPQAPEVIADRYAAIALRMVGCLGNGETRLLSVEGRDQ